MKYIVTVACLYVMSSCTYKNAEEVFGSANCQTAISYEDKIKPILSSTCSLSGCHDSGSPQGDWTVPQQVADHAALIQFRISNGTMPPPGSGLSLDQEEIDLITCWAEQGAPIN